MSHNGTHLAVIDLETTGLDPHAGHILEIGVVIVDAELCEVDAFAVLVASDEARIWARAVWRRGPGPDLGPAEQMHLDNGLIDELLDAPLGARSGVISEVATTVSEAAAAIVAALDRNGIDEPIPMVGSSVRALDAPFLEVHAPQLAARFSHRTIDASALTEFARFVDPDGATAVMASIPGSGHRTLGDCRRSLLILRAFAQHYGIGAQVAATRG